MLNVSQFEPPLTTKFSPPMAQVRSPRMRSVEATRAVWKCKAKLTPRELLVLQVIASHANDSFESWPGIDLIASAVQLKSRRQVIRLTQRLREKGLIEFDNRGGRGRSNVYRLLLNENGDTKNSDLPLKGDVSALETVTPPSETVTTVATNGDIATSPEWIERLEGNDEGRVEWARYWNADPTPLRPFRDALNELCLEDGRVLPSRLDSGTEIVKRETCGLHGEFTRSGIRFGHWMAWHGVPSLFCDGFQFGAGCSGCESKHSGDDLETSQAKWKRGIPMRAFELRSPVRCSDHGAFILALRVWERHPDLVAQGMDRFDFSCDYNDYCPGCEADWIHESETQENLGLTSEQWARGGDAILAAIHAATA